MPSIGAFRWSFGLNYRQNSGISDILGPDFSYPQPSRLEFGFKSYSQEIIADRPIDYWKLDDATVSTARDEMVQLPASYPAGASVGEIGAISDGGRRRNLMEAIHSWSEFWRTMRLQAVQILSISIRKLRNFPSKPGIACPNRIKMLIFLPKATKQALNTL